MNFHFTKFLICGLCQLFQECYSLNNAANDAESISPVGIYLFKVNKFLLKCNNGHQSDVIDVIDVVLVPVIMFSLGFTYESNECPSSF